jgi:Protein of unknown function (DUF3108)
MVSKLFVRAVFTGLLALTTAEAAMAAGGDSYDAQAGVKATNVQMVWHIDLAGVNLGKLGLSATLKGKEYSATSWLETRGIVNVFWDSRIDADSRGVIEAGVMVPESYNSDYKGAKSTQKVALAFTGGFPAKLIAVPEYDLNRFPVSDEQKKGTVDPLSGMILAIAGVTVSADAPCGTTIPVFDGKRRYNVNMKFRHEVMVDEGKHGYRGPALECALEYEQIAGFKPQLDPEDRSMPQTLAWVIPVKRTDDPSKLIYMPVKIWAETAFGTAMAMARHMKVNDAEPQSTLAAVHRNNEGE